MTQLIELPTAPVNASPVPHLTSIHSHKGRGPYGDARYRDNCGGHLIKDLLQYYKPNNVLDLMNGSGTCRDVCDELSLPYYTMEIKGGRDARASAHFG